MQGVGVCLGMGGWGWGICVEGHAVELTTWRGRTAGELLSVRPPCQHLRPP